MRIRPRTRRFRSAERGDEAGFSLVEVMVGMSILSIFFAIFGGSLISVFGSANRTQQSARAQTSANQIFLRLDREIRYASGISQPGLDLNGYPAVEFVTDYTGTAVCTEIRLTSGGDLVQRTWNRDVTPVVMGTPVLLATGVFADTPSNSTNSNALVSGPFATIPAAGTANAQQLEVAVRTVDVATSGTVLRTRHTDVTFTAQNTGTSTASNSVCSQGRSIAWPSTG